jgi:hypothetical protein
MDQPNELHCIGVGQQVAATKVATSQGCWGAAAFSPAARCKFYCWACAEANKNHVIALKRTEKQLG